MHFTVPLSSMRSNSWARGYLAEPVHVHTACQQHHPLQTVTPLALRTGFAEPRHAVTGNVLRQSGIAAQPSAAAAPATPPVSSASPLAAKLSCQVQQAVSAAELRAAAFLRAVTFYTYPPGRSEFAARSHRQMKANAEWESVTAKVEGCDVAYRDLDVTCYIATVDDPYLNPNGSRPTAPTASDTTARLDDQPSTSIATTTTTEEEFIAALRSGLDASAQLPAEPGWSPAESVPGTRSNARDDPEVGRQGRGLGPRPRRLVVGSLDLNVGHTLPSEELIGRMPPDDPRTRRAYLSNVCVAPTARRVGVARALLCHAEEEARRKGVEWLYVHVVADNTPAVALYCGASGFQVEQAESEGVARALQRPKRLLLAKRLE